MKTRGWMLAMAVGMCLLTAAKCDPTNDPGPQPGPPTAAPALPAPPVVAGPRRYVAPTDPAPAQPATTTAAVRSGGCLDPWVTQAVKSETGIMPGGEVCDVQLYHGGQWDSYATLALAVHDVMSTCADKWVTQAFLEVVGRLPSPSECNIYLYNNGQWDGNYERLRSYVAIARGRSGDELFSPGLPAAAVRHYSVLDASGAHELRQFHQCWYILTGDQCSTYPVVRHPHLHVIYWGKEWNEGAGASLRDYLNAGVDFMVNRSHYLDGLSQYGVSKGYGWDSRMDATSGPQALHNLVDPAAFFQVQGEIEYQQSTPQTYPVPRDWASDSPDQPIVVVLVPETSLGWDLGAGQWAGYHFLKYTNATCDTCYGYVPYVVVKVPQQAFWIDGSAIADVMNDVSHEVVEAATNPFPLYGWADWGAATDDLPVYDAAEPSDLCQAVLQWEGYAKSATYVSVKDPNTGYTYWLARYWSNSGSGCYPYYASSVPLAPGETVRHLL